MGGRIRKLLSLSKPLPCFVCSKCTLRVATENERIEDEKRDSRVLEEYNLCNVLSWVAVAKYTFWNRDGTVPIQGHRSRLSNVTGGKRPGSWVRFMLVGICARQKKKKKEKVHDDVGIRIPPLNTAQDRRRPLGNRPPPPLAIRFNARDSQGDRTLWTKA